MLRLYDKQRGDAKLDMATSGTEDELFDIIFNGRPMVSMKGFCNTLNPDDIRGIVTFIRSEEPKK